MKNFLKVFGSTVLSLVLIFGALHFAAPKTQAQSSGQSLFESLNGYSPVPTSIPFHVVIFTQALSGGAATVTLAGNAVYTSTSTFGCVGIDQTAANAVRAVPASASTVTLAGTTTDTVYGVCFGN